MLNDSSCYIFWMLSNLVSGEANFVMPSTYLTVGGFTQPGVARTLIELPTNAEKGFTHHFMWIFPRPLYQKFSALTGIDEDFTEKLSKFSHIRT